MNTAPDPASDPARDTGRAQPHTITVVCHREGHRGYWSARRFFLKDAQVVLQVLPQEDDPPNPDGSDRPHPFKIGLRSERQLMEEAPLSIRDGGVLPEAAPAGAAGAVPPQLAALLAMLPDLQAVLGLGERLDDLALDVEGMGTGLRDAQRRLDVLMPGEVDTTGATESHATLQANVRDLGHRLDDMQGQMDAIPAQVDGLRGEVAQLSQTATSLLARVEALLQPQTQGEASAPPPPAPAADAAGKAKADKPDKAKAPAK